MPRGKRRRMIDGPPPCGCFKPAGIPARQLEQVVLNLDEYEALKLADHEGLYQEEVAERMGVSRPTVTRILNSARNKVASALVEGKSIRIEGGAVRTRGMRVFGCLSCGHDWELPFGGGRPGECPSCGSGNIRRADSGPRGGRGRGCKK